MRLQLLKQTGNTNRLILIFAGWGSDASAYSHVEMAGWDVALVTGIDDCVPDFTLLNRYDTVYVYAWSLGVYAAESVLPGRVNPVRAFAINGTPRPCNDEEGIPTVIFRGTSEGLNERTLRKFRIRMFGGISAYALYADLFEGVNDIVGLQAELEFVATHPLEGSEPKLNWTTAYISESDRVFPPANQFRAWESHADIELLADTPHYVDIQHIVCQTIIDVEKVGKRFSRSMDTYNSHAHAQRFIAEQIVERFLHGVDNEPESVIEIGPGTGLFTNRWGKCIHPRKAVFIDLYTMPQYGVAAEECYISEDAERVLQRLATEEPGTVDAVLSASAIQWFSDFNLFFSNCASVLKPGGYIAMSTFAPGNLEELTRLRPDYLRYQSVENLKSVVSKYFSGVNVVEEKVELEFTSPLEALRHLQLTGVTTSGTRRASVAELRKFAATFPMNPRGRYTLTFRPIYIFATL